MKRGFALVLMLTHLIAVTGVFASVHYCGHAITHFSLGTETDDTNCACNEVKKTDCCSDLVVKASVKPEARMAKENKLTHNLLLVAVLFPTHPVFPSSHQVNSNSFLLDDSPGYKGRSAIGVWRI